ncbi:MAG: enoyl-CoA hydratase/isomerase family protein [Candidatus Hydrogenedentes bacterium]|nr:enoyl-CoA hydratase/isomerase family protein [Candidatus Hydrogenedentota bacterium]
MDHVVIERHEDIALVRMHRGKANPINRALVEDMFEAFKRLEHDPEFNAVILASASEKIFCAGFDMDEVFAYDRPGMAAFFGRFMDLFNYLVRFPKPTIAAVNGHALAGGAIFALVCDERIFVEGNYGFALNEIDLGIVLTPGIFQLAANAMGVNHARTFVLTGESLSPEAAFDVGAVRALVPREDLETAALKRAAELAAKPPQAMGILKGLVADHTGFPKETADRAYLDVFLDHWFSEECLSARKAVAAKVRK